MAVPALVDGVRPPESSDRAIEAPGLEERDLERISPAVPALAGALEDVRVLRDEPEAMPAETLCAECARALFQLLARN